MAVAGSNSSDWTLGLGTPICYGCNPKKKKEKKILNNIKIKSWEGKKTQTFSFFVFLPFLGLLPWQVPRLGVELEL